MKRIVIVIVTICMLMLCTVWNGSAALRQQVGFDPSLFRLTGMGSSEGISVEYLDNQSVTYVNGLPCLVRHFVVTNGELDSVSNDRIGRTILAQDISIRIEEPVATFAGDAVRDAEFYGRKLALVEPSSRASLVVDRGRMNDLEVVTILLRPLSYDEQLRELSSCAAMQLDFHGSSDLRIGALSNSEELGLSKAQGAGMSLRSVSAAAEYLIVTGAEFGAAFDDLIEWKTAKGLTVEIAFIEDIIASSTGNDDAERLRNFLITKHSQGTKYVLLGGDEEVIPIRYAYHANTSTQPEIDLMNICDLYYGDVNGNWDADGDGVFGEPSQDQPDLYAELLVGRLPFHHLGQFEAYIEKLVNYEQNPGAGNYEYLNRALFISADQMRDYQTVGQHALLAASYPSYVTSDVSEVVEAPTGDAENPQSPLAAGAIQTMSSGWGMMTLLIHGVSDGWVLRSNQYNQWPKSFLFTASGSDGDHGFLPNIESNGKPGVIYSIGCDNAAFDMDTAPFPSTNPCVAESFLAKPDGGAVCFVGYSRWGWVASSWRLEQAFIDYLYNQNNNAAEAVRQSKAEFSYYRDLCYGLNYLGDPDLSVWTDVPQESQITVEKITQTGVVNITAVLTDGSSPVAGALASVRQNGQVVAQAVTGADGSVVMTIDYNVNDDFSIMAYAAGHAVAAAPLVPEIVLDADDETGSGLPESFALYQNFPNPFNPVTTISFDLPTTAEVVVEIYNVLGQLITTKLNTFVSAGSHELAWDGTDDTGRPVSSGVYFARLSTANYSSSIKMSLLK